jgi:hypothetical protein
MTRRARLLGVLALALATFVAVRWLEPAPAPADTSGGVPSRVASQDVSSTSGAVDVDGRARSPSAVQSPGSPPPSAGASGPAVPELTVQLPASAQVGDVFSFVVHVDTRQLVGKIAILLEYDFKRLALRSSGEGDFVKHSGVPQRFSAEEPSDGKVSVNLQVADGMPPVTGFGSVAILEFEAKARGPATIDLTSITMFRTPEEALPLPLAGRQSQVFIN